MTQRHRTIVSTLLLVTVLAGTHLFRRWSQPKLFMSGVELHRDNILLTRSNVLPLVFAVEVAQAVPSGLAIEVLVNESNAASVNAPGWARAERESFVAFTSGDFKSGPSSEFRSRHRFPTLSVRLDTLEVIGLSVNVNRGDELVLGSRVHFIIDENLAEGHFVGAAVEKILRPITVRYSDRMLYSRPRRARFSWE